MNKEVIELAASIRPFITHPPKSPSEVDEIIGDVATAINRVIDQRQERIDYFHQWIFEGRFTFDGLTFIRGTNDVSALAVLDKIFRG